MSILGKPTIKTSTAEAALAFAGKAEEGETARLNANIKMELHTALKVRAATEKTTIGALIEGWIAGWSGKK